MNQRELAVRLSNRTRLDREFSIQIVSFVVDLMYEALLEGQAVKLRRIGKLHWRKAPEKKIVEPRTRKTIIVPERWMLKFVPSGDMRRMKMNEDGGMEKYGVVLDDQKVKEAEKKDQANSCPECGALLDNGGACPRHGTEPMEKR